MIELFNRLLEKHGSRLRLVECQSGYLRFKLGPFKEYEFSQVNGGSIRAEERVKGNDWKPTASAAWLLRVAQGQTRDNEGKVA